MTLPLARSLQRALADHSDADIAAGQFAYMKGIQPFRGVKTPERRALLRECLAEHPVTDFDAYRSNIHALWTGNFREERYLALDLAVRAKAFRSDALPLFEEMLAEADWWDVLDPLAADLLGGALRDKRNLLARKAGQWRRSDHLWARRAALLVQLKYRQETDTDLLGETVLMLAPETDFFIRKAIGWALREYSKTDSRWVRQFVRSRADVLSPLSRREALKWLERR
ncbi:MAG TPA: DNA alkylation repair protein [Gammaproteobacteria bacterium]